MADRALKNPAKKPSVTGHPLFPAIVVVWFAALFGLVSLAIRPSLIESLVLATGIDHVIAKAAPPLGHTAHLLIVLAMTALGAVVGIVVARRLAKTTHAPRTRRRRSATIADGATQETSSVGAFGRAEPIVGPDHEDDEAPTIARRRSQLALLDEDSSLEEHAPALAAAPSQILDVAELPLKSFDEIDGIWLHDSEHTTLRSSSGTGDAQTEKTESGSHVESGRQVESASQDVPIDLVEALADDAAETASHPADDSAGKPGNRLFDTYVRRLNAGVGSNDPEVAAPGFVSLETSEDESQAVAAQPAPVAAEPLEATAAYGTTAERIASAPLDQLSHVELLERLAQTIARRRAQVSTPTAIDRPEDVASVAVLPRVAAPQVVRPGGEIPAALRPHWAVVQDDDHDDADTLPAFVPARSIALPKLAVSAARNVTPISQPDGEERLEEGYSSLQGMTKPVRDAEIDAAEETARSEASWPARFAAPDQQEDRAPATNAAPQGPRAFDAPHAVGAQPDQTEQALRAALATLRRMSGTA